MVITGPGCRLFSLRIPNPLGIQGLEDVLNTAKVCIDSNFIPSFLTIAGSVLALHYEKVMGMLDCCLIALAYSKESGTGASHTQLKVVCIL